MGRLEDNLRHAHMIKDAESSLDDAVKLLKEATKYLRAREPLPDNLADFLADAFDIACAKKKEECAVRLVRELHLVNDNRRPLNHEKIGQRIQYLRFKNQINRITAVRMVAKEFGVSIRSCQTAYTNNRTRQYFEKMNNIRREAERLADELMAQGMVENAASNRAILTTAEKYKINPKTIHYEYPLP